MNLDDRPEPEIRRNRAQCLKCLDIIESVHRHDFKYCKCGEIFVDGGKAYLRRGWTDPTKVLELSEYEPRTPEAK